MTTLNKARPRSAALADLSDSLDVRLAVAGRLSATAIHIHRERAELATVLAPAVPPVDSSAAAAAKEN
jgi:hypothetical protein